MGLDVLSMLVLSWASPNIAAETSEASKLSASWYLPPRQHIFEVALIACTMVPAVVIVQRRARRSGGPTAAQIAARPGGGPHNAGIAAALAGFLAAQIIYKSMNGRLLFMLQPCHVMTLLLLVAALCPAPSAAGAYAYTTYMHNIFYPISAMLFPDVRDLVLPGELFFFVAQHVVLLVAPFVMLRRGSQPLYHQQVILHWLLFNLFNMLVLAPVGLRAGVNVNYITHPPKPLLMFGRAYRMAMVPLTLMFAALSRLAIVPGGCRLFGLPMKDDVKTSRLSRAAAEKDDAAEPDPSALAA